MIALANTQLGAGMNASHVQVYGWVEVGGNLSTNSVKPGGNVPVGYDYTPNTVQLDQTVVYIERLPDTVQNDHFDWGFRLSAIYGVDYRYTTAYGLFSYQLLNHNFVNGYDFPMEYVDLYFPVMQGLDVRIGRFISIPDIEAQLAPNNYTYVHSLTYTYDNFTNTGILNTLAVTKNWMVQLGVVVGTETMPWNIGATMPNPNPNPLYPGTTMLRDPGAQPSAVAGLRWTSDSGRDDVYLVANSINNGVWATIICNGLAARTITSSTIIGTSLSRAGTSTNLKCRTWITRSRPRRSPVAARRSAHRSCRSMLQMRRIAAMPLR
jgi:Putative beta-barrel porin-2, OmpL-like. bbp2